MYVNHSQGWGLKPSPEVAMGPEGRDTQHGGEQRYEGHDSHPPPTAWLERGMEVEHRVLCLV